MVHGVVFSTLLPCVGASVVHLTDSDVVANSNRTAAAGIKWVCLCAQIPGRSALPKLSGRLHCKASPYRGE